MKHKFLSPKLPKRFIQEKMELFDFVTVITSTFILISGNININILDYVIVRRFIPGADAVKCFRVWFPTFGTSELYNAIIAEKKLNSQL